jgi:hypothetical protein
MKLKKRRALGRCRRRILAKDAARLFAKAGCVTSIDRTGKVVWVPSRIHIEPKPITLEEEQALRERRS